MKILIVDYDAARARAIKKALEVLSDAEPLIAFHQIDIDQLAKEHEFAWVAANIDIKPKGTGKRMFLSLCAKPSTSRAKRIVFGSDPKHDFFSAEDVQYQNVDHWIIGDDIPAIIARIISES